MIARRFSTVQPPPNPSAVSARPSSCNAPVMTILVATARSTAINGSQIAPASNHIAADTIPTPIPTTGKYFPDRDNQSGSIASLDGATGMIVMNRSAFRKWRRSIISDISGQHVAEIGDIGQKPRCRTHQRHSEQRAGAFAEPQSEIEQRLRIERCEYDIVAFLRGAMREHAGIPRRAHPRPRHHRDLQAAEFAKHVERC